MNLQWTNNEPKKALFLFNIIHCKDCFHEYFISLLKYIIFFRNKKVLEDAYLFFSFITYLQSDFIHTKGKEAGMLLSNFYPNIMPTSLISKFYPVNYSNLHSLKSVCWFFVSCWFDWVT